MDAIERIIFGSWVFRIIIVLIGLAVIYWGLRLFRQPGSPNRVGQIEASYKEAKVSIRGAAGTFLVVLGTIILIAALFKPMEFDRKTRLVLPDGTVLDMEDKGMPALADSTYKMRDSVRARDSGRSR